MVSYSKILLFYFSINVIFIILSFQFFNVNSIISIQKFHFLCLSQFSNISLSLSLSLSFSLSLSVCNYAAAQLFLSSLYSEFFFFCAGCLTKAKELSLLYCLLMAGMEEWSIHTFLKGISANSNVNSFIQDLNLSRQFHFPQW